MAWFYLGCWVVVAMVLSICLPMILGDEEAGTDDPRMPAGSSREERNPLPGDEAVVRRSEPRNPLRGDEASQSLG